MAAVYYKFKSAKDYNSIPLDGPFISVGELKVKIVELKRLGRGRDFDLLVTNAQTNEEYHDETLLIPMNTSVEVRRVPGLPRKPIVIAPLPEPNEDMVANECVDVQTEKDCFVWGDSSTKIYADALEADDFGIDLYEIPGKSPGPSSNPVQDAHPGRDEEDQKIKALVESSAFEWQEQSSNGYDPGRGFGHGTRGKMGSHGFGRGGILERKTPPEGYVCYRCKVPGHFIQHCPTNGDPDYDIKRVKPPTGIPKTMLIAAPNGAYKLASGAVAVLKPDEAAFDKEMEGLLSRNSTGDLPPELYCPLCKGVMKDAVLTSKCCFTSFCDKCIRDFTISKSMCMCGAKNVLADYLVPNMTLRETINRMLESDNSSGKSLSSASQVHGEESHNSQPKASCSAQSEASKGEKSDNSSSKSLSSASQVHGKESHNSQPKASCSAQSEASKGEKAGEAEPKKIEALGGQELANGVDDVSSPNQTSEKLQAHIKLGETHEAISVNEPSLHGTYSLVAEKEYSEPVSTVTAKKKKSKKAQVSMNGPGMQWIPQGSANESFMMSMAYAHHNPYWSAALPGFEGFVGSYAAAAAAAPYMGFPPGPFAVPFAGVFPQDPFAGPACPLPFVPPQRQKRIHKEVINNGDKASSMNIKSKSIPSPPKSEHPQHRHRSERSSPERRDVEPPRPLSKRKSEERSSPKRRDAEPPRPLSKRKSEEEHRHRYHEDDRDRRQREHHHRDHRRSSDSYREDRKSTSMSRRSSSRDVDYENGDEDRHFKRRTSRHESPAPSWSEERERVKRRRVEQLVC